MPVVIGLDLQLFADGLRHEQALLNQPERRLRRHPGCDQGRLRRHPQISICHGGMRGSADLLSKLETLSASSPAPSPVLSRPISRV